MRRLRTIFLCTLPLLFTQAGAAENEISVQSSEHTTAVLELYTSEGCSSCPPADKWLSALKPHLGKELHVVPLAFHVDYWNYLGWKDKYSKARYTERQRKLGKLNRQSTIYTPEFFVNSEEQRNTGKIISNIQKTNQRKSRWALSMTASLSQPSGDNLQVDVSGEALVEETNATAELFIGLYENNIVRKIERGENTGKTLNHDFVVRKWFGPISLNKQSSISYQQLIRFPEDSQKANVGVVAVLYEKDKGDILQAVSTDLESLF